jgi:hypothetical protein
MSTPYMKRWFGHPVQIESKGEDQLSLPGLASFTEQVGSTFEVENIFTSPPALRLVRVVEHSRTETNEAFSVFFLGSPDHFMPQGTHTLKHPQFGKMEIFLVPVAKTNTGFEYEAVFNYILSTQEKEKHYG